MPEISQPLSEAKDDTLPHHCFPFRLLVCFVLITMLQASPAVAQSGRLIATGGATQIEGAAGGGLVPWAILSSLATRDEIGATSFYTYVDTGDFTLHSTGAAVNFRNRVEISAARQTLGLGTLGIVLGVPGTSLTQDVVGVKVRLANDAIYSAWPQISAGAQYKKNRDFAIPQGLGARKDSGTDLYLAGSKVFLAGLAGRNLVVNGTLRATKANQLGLLGFGAESDDGYELHPEGSIALFLNPQVVMGVEYRSKPDNLAFSEEDAWADLFFGYFPNKNLAIVGAFVDLGTTATLENQSGFYLSVQLTF